MQELRILGDFLQFTLVSKDRNLENLNMIKLYVAFLAMGLALLSSCATSFPPPDAATIAADERAQPKPSISQAEDAIREMAFNCYKDPESLKLRGTFVHEFGIASPTGLAGNNGYIQGYKVTTILDAKNGNGAYGGYKAYEFIYSHGRVTETVGWSLTDSLTWVPWTKYTFYPKQELDRIRSSGGSLQGSPIM